MFLRTLGGDEVFKELINKTTIANVCAGVCVVGMLVYAVYVKDTELVKLAGVFSFGYLFGLKTNHVTNNVTG